MATNFATNQGGLVEPYFTNSSGNIVFARCAVANMPTGAGYAIGAIIEASDTGQTWTNLGTTAAAVFSLDTAGSGAHPSKAAINATGTATAAQVATGYITSTSASATTITLPTGTLLGTALGATQGTMLDLYIDNTAGASTVTMAVAVNGIKSDAANTTAGSFGQMTVAAGVTGIGRFTIMFSSATAYVFTRTA